ncbi:hypothetical protein DCAR_0313301 [Daucus carota subsp. sativus]|uniref:Uncharacterized protein n=1 Tax=Daucus carota subsp. sativus TaxID=79200 RepID=A0A162ALW5_DAUCS|nr:hypothetical protein DCAR_0313301 [Daucus carota subsp. sativus]
MDFNYSTQSNSSRSRRTFNNGSHYNLSSNTANSNQSISQVRPAERSIKDQTTGHSITTFNSSQHSDSSYSISQVRPAEKSIKTENAGQSVRISNRSQFSPLSTDSYQSVPHLRPAEKSIKDQNADHSMRTSNYGSHLSSLPTGSNQSISQVRPSEKSMTYQSAGHNGTLSTMSTDSYQSISQVHPPEKSTRDQSAGKSTRTFNRSSRLSTQSADYQNEGWSVSKFHDGSYNSSHATDAYYKGRPQEKSIRYQSLSQVHPVEKSNIMDHTALDHTTNSHQSTYGVHSVEKSVRFDRSAWK